MEWELCHVLLICCHATAHSCGAPAGEHLHNCNMTAHHIGWCLGTPCLSTFASHDPCVVSTLLNGIVCCKQHWARHCKYIVKWYCTLQTTLGPTAVCSTTHNALTALQQQFSQNKCHCLPTRRLRGRPVCSSTVLVLAQMCLLSQSAWQDHTVHWNQLPRPPLAALLLPYQQDNIQC